MKHPSEFRAVCGQTGQNPRKRHYVRIGGKPFTVAGEYRKIERPRLPVFTWLPDWYENAAESLVHWDLEEKDGVTTVRLTHSGLASESSRNSHRGWPQILGWLQAYVEKQI